MKDVIIIDKAVPNGIQESLEKIALGNAIPWNRHGRATYNEGQASRFPVTPESYDAPQFTHSIYEINQPVSQLFHAILPVITAIPYTIRQLIRIKMNLGLYVKLDKVDAHGMPHVDFTEISEPLMSAIYYVNESSGDTVIFDQKYGHRGPLTVKARVAPRRGRLVVFDGALLHAGNTPRDNTPRVNINFNAFVYEGPNPLRTVQ